MRRYSWSVLMVMVLMSSPSSRASESVSSDEEPIYQGKTLTEWVGDLKAPQRETQRIAAKALAVFGPKKEAVSALRAVLKSDDVRVVLLAAQTLGKFGVKAKEALPELHGAYKRVSAGPPTLPPGGKYSEEYLKLFADARRAIAEALILIDNDPGPELAPVLIEALKSEDADKCRDLVIKLGKLGPEAAKSTVPVLIGILTDTEKRLQRQNGHGSVTLFSSSDSPFDFPPEKFKAIRLETVKALGRIGPQAKPALHAITLAMKSAAPAEETLLKQLEISEKPLRSINAPNPATSFTVIDGDKAMLQACAEALGRIRPEVKGTLGALRLALCDLDDDVRWAALCALLETGQDTMEVVSILLKFLRDQDAACRRVAATALGKSRAEMKQLEPAMEAALKDKDDCVRKFAAKALGDFGPKAKQSASALIAALKDSDWQVRHQAAESLGKILPRNKDVIPALIAALQDEAGSVFEAAAEALTKFGAEAKASIPAIIVLLQNSGTQKRGQSCLFLGQFGPVAKEAIPVLEQTAKEDSEEGVRLVAYAALAKIDSSRVKDTVRRLVTSLQKEELRGASVECLGFLGPEARDALSALHRLREDDFQNRGDIDRAIEAIEKPKEKPGEH